MLKILVVEDHALVLEGLLQSLRELERDVISRGVRDATEALELLLAEGEDYDLCLLDLMLPGLNGMGCLGMMRKRFPALPVVIVSALDDRNTVARAMRAGASGFISKSSTNDDFLMGLRKVLAGEICLPPTLDDELPTRHQRGNRSLEEQYALTTSQMRVLELLTEGMTNRQISELLGLAEGTVKVHVSAIFKALNVTNRAQALLTVKRHKSTRL